MNPVKIILEKVEILTDLPNVGTTVANDLKLIGITQLEQFDL